MYEVCLLVSRFALADCDSCSGTRGRLLVLLCKNGVWAAKRIAACEKSQRSMKQGDLLAANNFTCREMQIHEKKKRNHYMQLTIEWPLNSMFT